MQAQTSSMVHTHVPHLIILAAEIIITSKQQYNLVTNNAMQLTLLSWTVNYIILDFLHTMNLDRSLVMFMKTNH